MINTLALISASLIPALSWLSYRYLLRDTRRFALNRALLLLAMSGSLILPWLTIPTLGLNRLPLSIQEVVYASLPEVLVGASTSPVSNLWSPAAIIYLYWGVVLLLGSALLLNVLRIGWQIRKAKPAEFQGRKFRLGQRGQSYSFFNFIVLDPDLMVEPDQLLRVLAHEEAHRKQGHSADAVLAELVRVLFWFNPFAWMLPRMVSENCEFLADRASLRALPGLQSYARLLINSASASVHSGSTRALIAPSFEHSQTKRRLIMLSNSTTPKKHAIRYGMSIVLTVLGFALCACSKQDKDPSDLLAQRNRSENSARQSAGEQSASDEAMRAEEVDVMPEFPGGMNALMEFLSSEIRYPEAASEAGTEGRVIIDFVVLPNGSLSNVNIIKGFDPDCDAEALRAVKAMPNWNPGQKGGVAVPVRLYLPVVFALS